VAPTAPAYLPLQLPKSYRRFTRQEFQSNYVANGQTDPKRIDPTGTLLGILCTFNGTLTTGATAPTLTNGAPYELVKYVAVTVNSGVGRTIYIPAYALNVFERVREQDFLDAPSTPTAINTVNAWQFSFHVPVCVRDGDLYGDYSDYLGALYTGDQELTVQVQLVFNSEATIISNQGAAAAVLAGTFTFSSFKLDTPRPSDDINLLQSISWVHQFVEEKSGLAIAAAGSLNLDSLPTSDPRVYLRVIDLVKNNGAYTNGVYASIDANLQDFVDFEQTVAEQVWLERQRRRYIATPPPGTYVLDFAAGNRRDNWFPVQRATLFKVTPTISGVALVNAVMSRYSEIVVPSPIAKKWTALAVQSGNWNRWTTGKAA
jgi:hypothetical protein